MTVSAAQLEAMGIEARLNAAENVSVVENLVDGVKHGVRQVLGPVALAGAATFVAYVAGNVLGDGVPYVINAATGKVFEHNIVSIIPGFLEGSIAVPRGYGLTEVTEAMLRQSPGSISSGQIAAFIPGGVFLGYVGSKIIGPIADSVRGRYKQ
ncbi:hypothetical protein HYV82_02450 [Candidatus Woesearchaeota archaeon]|nr:hypothetical protein [Candidatus Woesearchaeota archaeon]